MKLDPALPQHVTDLLGRLKGVEPTGSRKWRALCPAHDDHNPSLDIDLGSDDRVLLICRSRRCPAEKIVAEIGTSQAALFAPPLGTDPRMPKMLSLQALADSKRLPVAFLRDLGLSEKAGAVLIPYLDGAGQLIAI